MAALAARPVAVKAQASRPSRSTSVVCHASSRRELLGLGALVAFTALAPAANAGVVDDLLAKSKANKALNDKKRLATSSANLARTRTVYDGTCALPYNFFGCEELALNGGVKYIKEDIKLECEGKAAGACASKPNMKFK